MIVSLLPVCGAAFQQKESEPAGKPGACSPSPNSHELSCSENGLLEFAGESWCPLAVTAPMPWNLSRGRRDRNVMILWGCVLISMTFHKTLLYCTLDQTGMAKPLNSATGFPRLGKSSHLIINYSKSVYYFIFLGILP